MHEVHQERKCVERFDMGVKAKVDSVDCGVAGGVKCDMRRWLGCVMMNEDDLGEKKVCMRVVKGYAASEMDC